MTEQALALRPSVPALRQPALLDICPVTEAVETLAKAGAEERGAIFTRPEVVNFILDLSGYTEDRPLHRMRLLEPSFGDGDFLGPVIDRLMSAWKKASGTRDDSVADLAPSLRAVELHSATFAATKQKIIDQLCCHDLSEKDAQALADIWLIHSDFLLCGELGSFDFVVGNPPYVRQELIADVLMAEYRARYATIYDRADLYVPFIERSLAVLCENGVLGFICADRWIKNRYGGPLRRLVAEQFHLRAYVDMTDTPAFYADVIAYPAIVVIARERGQVTRIAHRPHISADLLSDLAMDMVAPSPALASVRECERVASGNEPWILDHPEQLQLVRRLEVQFPTLEEAGCKVGIGVATGADQAFIGPYETLDVENDHKLPLVMTRDILDGEVKWRGLGIVNPFTEEGKLADLSENPRLQAYLETRRDQISKRHVAKKAPANWYRTIDRIYPSLTWKPKLLIPDIKGEANIVYEPGDLYPHHNLYYITVEQWDLMALQAVLKSGIAKLFVSIYSPKMRGGYLRFQAQYLRRIRVPHWHQVCADVRNKLTLAAASGDASRCNKAVSHLYGLTPDECALLHGDFEQKERKAVIIPPLADDIVD